MSEGAQTLRPDGASADEMKLRAVFQAALDAMLVADDDRRFTDVNPAACRLLGRAEQELLGLRIEDVSPLGTDVESAWRAFLEAGELGGEYVLERPDGSQVEVEFRAKANVLPGQHLSILREVTARKDAERALLEVNDRLQAALDRERRVALALQQAMLPAAVGVDGLDIATRYLPAARGIKVCGDWYDVVDLGAGRVAVAVGDVVGHGLAAAGVMGQLRSALAAATHAHGSPSKALSTLERDARSLGGDLLATVIDVVLDLEAGQLTYSSAGHPPGLLLADGRPPRLLDLATAPPLGVTLAGQAQPEAALDIPAGATLLLFTDGLIERRGQDIDEGLAALTGAAQRHVDLRAEALAQTVLDELVPGGSADDDVALVVIKL